MPTYMEQLIEALGGHPVDYDSKCMSVGSTSMLTLEDSSLAMTAAVLSDAIQSGADLVVSACTISHINLDSYQSKAGRVSGKRTSVPVCHLAELVAFCSRVLSRPPRTTPNPCSSHRVLMPACRAAMARFATASVQPLSAIISRALVANNRPRSGAYASNAGFSSGSPS